MQLPAILKRFGFGLSAGGARADDGFGFGSGPGFGWGRGFSSAYEAGSIDRSETAAWFPSLNSADSAILPRRDLTVARIRDIIRNDPHAKAGLDRLCDMIVGSGLWLSATPDADSLGITPDAARELGKDMQREWRAFANDPRRFNDAQRRLDMDGMFRLFARTWFSLGEATAVVTVRDDPLARYRTCILAISPDRLSSPPTIIETARMRAGVQMDAMGAPQSYYVRNGHPGDYLQNFEAFTWTNIPRSADYGRPVFIHAFEPEAEAQTRGVSPFITLILRLRMLGKFADHELASAALNALISGQIESDLPPGEVQQRLTPAADINDGKSYTGWLLNYFTKNPAHIGGARIPVLPTGTKLTMNNAPRQTTAFDTFQTAFLQSIAASLGISYEQISMDWRKTNYSSARAALNEVWRTTKRMFAAFTTQMVQPIYFAVMDEAFDRGYIKEPAGAPGFIEMPGAYLRCRWIGPGRGFIDPVKEAEAAALRMEGLTSTLERELADQGLPFEETLDQIAFENAELARRGLTRMSIVAATNAANRLKPDSLEEEAPVAEDLAKQDDGKKRAA